MPCEMLPNHGSEMFTQQYAPGGTTQVTSSAIAAGPEPIFVDVRDASPASALVIPRAELCDELRRAVYEAAGRDAESMKRLRVAIRKFTVALREIGTSPEHVLIALKTVINNRTLVAIAPHVSDWNGQELRERISTWCITEFFEKGSS